MVAKRGYKVRVLDQSVTTTTAPTTASTSTKMQTIQFTATAIPVTIYKLAIGQFAETSSPTARPQNGGHSSVQNPPPLEDIPKAHSDRVLLGPMQVWHQRIYLKSGRTDLFPYSSPPTPTPTMKTEEQPKTAAIPCIMAMPKQATEKCSWEQHCPICKDEEEHGEEDWDDSLQNQPRMHPQNLQPQTAQNPKPQNLQCPWPQTLQAEK